MAQTATKLPVKTEDNTPAQAAPGIWPGIEQLRQEVDHLFEDFGRGSWLRPFRTFQFEPIFRRDFSWSAPAVDVAEKDTAFEITAELPGLSPKDVDVSARNGNLVIKGEKHEEKEEEHKGYHVKERQYGSFERSFPIPDGVETSAIEATYNNGVLKVTLPKTADAQKPAKKIEVKAA